ncbi:hypothetical protein GF324_02590 [bacterium]|nr:hypothetical protein [bacterium]
MNPIRITINGIELHGELNDSETAKAVLKAMPLRFTGHYWGEEIYGTIPVKLDEAPDAVEVVEEIGTLAYWPVGNAICLFWGPTPVSRSDEMRAASKVNVIGKVTANLERFLSEKPDPPRIVVEQL